MNIAICDDNKIFAQELKREIAEIAAKNDLPIFCSLFSDPSELLSSDLGRTDCLFLDVDMPGMNGIEAARRIREKNDDLLIVFLTSFLEYAPAGYHVNAFRYLLKNSYQEQLGDLICEIQEKVYSQGNSILIHRKDEDSVVLLRHILYFEGTSSRTTLVHLTGSAAPLVCIGKQLSDFEKQLSSDGFLRIQKAFLVNMAHIGKISNYQVFLKNGQSLKASVKSYASVCEKYLQWRGRNL